MSNYKIWQQGINEKRFSVYSAKKLGLFVQTLWNYAFVYKGNIKNCKNQLFSTNHKHTIISVIHENYFFIKLQIISSLHEHMINYLSIFITMIEAMFYWILEFLEQRHTQKVVWKKLDLLLHIKFLFSWNQKLEVVCYYSNPYGHLRKIT